MLIKAVLFSLGLAVWSVSPAAAVTVGAGAACNQMEPIVPDTCSEGLICQLNYPAVGAAGGSKCAVQNGYLFNCDDSSQCTVPWNTLQLSCLQAPGSTDLYPKTCLVPLSPGDGGAACTRDDECTVAGELCLGGFCNAGFPASSSSTNSSGWGSSTGGAGFPGLPTLNCMVDGVSTCGAGTECFFGVCIPARTPVSCAGMTGAGCNVANGEVCNEWTGVCMGGGVPQCANCTGTCVPPAFAGSQNAPTCLPAGASCAGGAACVAGSNCYLGFCRPCGELCGLGDLLGPLFASVGALGDLGRRNASEVLAGLQADGGVLRPPQGQIMELNAALAGQLTRLSMDAAGGMTQLANGAALDIPNIVGSALNNQFLMQAGATLNAAAVQILADASLTFSLADGARARFSSLNLSAPLNCNGGSGSFFDFPSAPGQIESRGNGVVQASGGINLAGFAGAARISISGAADAIRDAAIASGATLHSAGDILGQTSRLLVTGTLQMTGRIFEPLLSLQSGARALIRSNAGSFNGGNVTFASMGSSELHINASAGAGTGGDNVYFRTIQSCPISATLVLNVVGSAASALSAGVTVFNYGVETALYTSSFQCNIKVCGTDGCITAANPNTASGRRLLGSEGCDGAGCDSSGTKTSASFGNTKLTVKSEQTGAASTLRASAAVVAAVFAAVVAVMAL